MANRLPGARARIAGADGLPTAEFYRFLQELQRANTGGANPAAIAAINAELAKIEAIIGELPTVSFPTLIAQLPLKSEGFLQNGYAKLVWAGTTSDVPEGSRLYYTDDRVRAVLGRTIVGFSFGDAPRAIYVVPDDRLAYLVRLVIDTPFDGTNAAIAVGTAADAGALMPANANDPTVAAGYEFASNTELALGDSVQLTITPGSGATQGSGRIILDAYQR
jgi:hypothetical protein